MNAKASRFALSLALCVGAAWVLNRSAAQDLPSASQAGVPTQAAQPSRVIVGSSYSNDTSLPLREIQPLPYLGRTEREVNENPRIPHRHVDAPDPVRQPTSVAAPSVAGDMPPTILNFEGISFPGVDCQCAPPDTDGEVGRTQYTQIVNTGFQVFDKTTGASVLGPIGIATLWSGFGGICETNGSGDPVVIYDQLADRWVISQFAGGATITDECIAVSTSSDATGSYNRYGFHLGSNYFDYPKLAMWPDAYYLSMNVFNAAGTVYLGPQPFAFNRTAMLAGSPATFISTGITNGSAEETYLPADLDGSILPPPGAPNTFIEWPSTVASALVYKLYHFHVDFAVPENSTFTLFATPPAAGFTALCSNTRDCVPQPGTSSGLDLLGDRMMFRAAYRNFGDHESLVTNYTVASNKVAGVRWLELRGVTAGPVSVYQESTYQPDTTWRWLGSAAMDSAGNLAIGFSASSSSVNPSIYYAGRLSSDPLNTLFRGEAVMTSGAGAQSGTFNRWGDYSAMSVDPVDDCTFWYTNQYYPAGISSFNWRTRIANFRSPFCTPISPTPAAAISLYVTADATTTLTGSPIGFTVTFTNTGNAPATSQLVADNLPAGTGVNWSIDAAGSSSGWSVGGSPPNQTLVYAPAALAGGASTHGHVISSTTAASGGTYVNTARFTADNGNSGSASAQIVVSAPFCTLAQAFNDTTTLVANGWAIRNNSAPIGLSTWFQGTSNVFTAQAGPANSYVAVNYNSGSNTAMISNWLLTPVLTLQDGGQLTFYTRTVNSPLFPDRLQVRRGGTGVSTDVGTTSTSVGDFSTVLLDVNPTYTTSGYPNNWTLYTITLSGLGAPTNGRLAFRYFVENGGPSGANSDYIGIDTLAFDCAQFTDPVLTAGVTVKAAHILEPRGRIDSLRARSGLDGYHWTDAKLGSPIAPANIKAQHILELRAALDEAYDGLHVTRPVYTAPAPAVGGVVLAKHIQEVRDAIRFLESVP